MFDYAPRAAQAVDSPVAVQPRRRVGQRGDAFEQEAEAAARAFDAGQHVGPVARRGMSSTAPSVPAGTLPGGAGTALPEAARQPLEAHFGWDFRHVRIHAGADAAAAAAQVGAQAFTAGAHIVFGAQAYAPHTEAGQHLLAHELTHVVQQATDAGVPRLQKQDGPRLAETTARRDPLDRHILVFSDAVTRERALEIVWDEGFRPPLEVFHPDHSDPWADPEAGRYQRFVFDYGNPVGRAQWQAMWDHMRPPVRRQYTRRYEEQPDLSGRSTPRDFAFPEWVPEPVRQAVLTGAGLTARGGRVEVGRMASARGTRWPMLVWRRTSPAGDIQFALEGLWPGDLAYYQRLNVDDGTARLLHRALRGWNADMTELVIDEGTHPRLARQIVRQRDRVKMIIALLELYSFMIPVRFGAPPGARALTQADAALTRESRRLAREMRRLEAAGASSPSRAPTLTPSRAPTLTPSRAPTLPPERAPTLPPEQAPTLPPERAPTLPADRAPTIPSPPRRAPTPEPPRAPVPEPLPGTERPAIPPPAPEHPVPTPEVPRPPRVPREFEVPPAGRASSPSPGAAGTQITEMTSEMAEAVWRAHPESRWDAFFGYKPVGAEHYRLLWQELGGTGAPPPHGFVVRDASGQVERIVFYWAERAPRL